MTSDYRILIGEVRVDRLREEDLYEIIDYGWDEHDLRRMLECRDYQAIACLAAWIKECGHGDHGMFVEDDMAEVA